MRPLSLRCGRGTRWTRSALAVALVVASVAAGASAQPRLFFDSGDIATLRLRVSTQEPYQSMWNALMAIPNIEPDPADPDPDPDKTRRYEYSYNARNNAMRYVLTGNTAYADAAKTYTLWLVNDTRWADPSYRALTRSMAAYGAAIAYDLCKDAWDTTTNDLVSQKLVDMGASLRASGGGGYPSGWGNNWRAVRYCGMGMCYLATDSVDETTRAAEVQHAFDKTVDYFDANLSTDPDAMGWNPEGGGYTFYPASFWAPFNAAVKRYNPAMDFLAENVAVQHTLVAANFVALPYDRGPSWYGTRYGFHPDYSDDNPHWDPQGVGGAWFQNVAPVDIGPMKWIYDHFLGSAVGGTYDTDRAGVLYSIVYYPDDVPAENPADVWGLTYMDPAFGITAFRNRFQDADDFVAQLNAKERAPSQTHKGADCNGFRLGGYGTLWAVGSGRTSDPRGQTTVFPYDPETYDSGNKNAYVNTGALGQLIAFHGRDPGDGYAIATGSSMHTTDHKRRMIVDYSGLSGSDAVFVIADTSLDGTWWRLNTLETNSVVTTADGFIITNPDGDSLYGTVLLGDTTTLRTGRFTRGSGFGFEGVSYDENVWVDFNSPTGQFLVVLVAVEDGGVPPEVTWSGSTLDDAVTIHVGSQWFTIDDEVIDAFSWQPQPPVVAVTAPDGGAALAHGTAVTVEASASDPDGEVVSVAFYAGATQIGFDDTPEDGFSCTWTGFGFGPHDLTAVATGNDTQETVSDPVAVEVFLGGDATRDGIVDTADYFRLSGNWYKPGGWDDGDFNGDGVVDTADYFILSGNWGDSVPTGAGE